MRDFDLDMYPSGGVIPLQGDLNFKGANIDFGDYISQPLSSIQNSASFAQGVANKRTEELLQERQKILDSIKLDKRFESLQGQLTSALDGVVDQAAKSQLSDNATFTKFNTGLLKIKNDPNIQNALRSTEYAKAYADWRIKNPNSMDKPYLNGGNEKNFQRFNSGETDEFIMNPTYTEPKWRESIFDFVKAIPDEDKEVFKTLGSAVYQEKTSGKSAETIKERTREHIDNLLNRNPETASHFQRMKQYGYNPEQEIMSVLESAANQYKKESIALSNMQVDPNVTTNQRQQEINIRQQNANTAYDKVFDENGDFIPKPTKTTKGLHWNSLSAAPYGEDKGEIKDGTHVYNETYKEEALRGYLAQNPSKKKLIENTDNMTIEGWDKSTGVVSMNINDKNGKLIQKMTYRTPKLKIEQEVVTPKPPTTKQAVAPKPPMKDFTQQDINNAYSKLKAGESTDVVINGEIKTLTKPK